MVLSRYVVLSALTAYVGLLQVEWVHRCRRTSCPEHQTSISRRWTIWKQVKVRFSVRPLSIAARMNLVSQVFQCETFANGDFKVGRCLPTGFFFFSGCRLCEARKSPAAGGCCCGRCRATATATAAATTTAAEFGRLWVAPESRDSDGQRRLVAFYLGQCCILVTCRNT